LQPSNSLHSRNCQESGSLEERTDAQGLYFKGNGKGAHLQWINMGRREGEERERDPIIQC